MPRINLIVNENENNTVPDDFIKSSYFNGVCYHRI